MDGLRQSDLSWIPFSVTSRRNFSLVQADWVLQRLHQSPTPTVIECGWNCLQDFKEGHLPSATYLDTTEFEADLELSPRNWWNLRPERAVLSCLESQGVAKQQTVIMYGRDPLAPARLAWVLLMAGHCDVCWLDGGLSAWQSRGFSLESGASPAVRVPANRWAEYSCPTYCWSLDQIRESSTEFSLIDIRSWAEHMGDTSGYSYIEQAGRIPGSIWGGGGSDSNSLEDFLNPDETLKPLGDIQQRWAKLGLTGKGTCVFYCGTGWRASVAFLCAYMLHWQNIAVFDGGWFEWSAPGKVSLCRSRTRPC